MEKILSEIEEAITEVTKARKSVLSGSSIQVSAEEEVTRLRSLAYAWFQNHRPRILAHHSKPDLSAVDAPYQKILEASGRRAKRQTYSDALREARLKLIVIRNLVATSTLSSPPVSSSPTPETAPSFVPLASDPSMQAILNRRWAEVQRCNGAQAYLAATVMMGGLLETLLLARINSSPNRPAVFTAKLAPRDKSKKTLLLSDWKLVNMVEVAHELGWITKSAKDTGNVLRDFRNYIHPHKEHTDNIVISEEDSKMFWEVTKAISRQVLASVGKSP